MNAKLHKSAFALSFGTLAAMAAVACGQGADPSSTELSSNSTSDALNTVITCQQQEAACGLDAGPTGFAACQKALQSCLMSLFPDAATLPTLPTLPEFDAALPTLPKPPALPDAGLPKLPTPPQFDAGLPTPPAGTVPPEAACLDTLQTCLFSGTTPTTCATDAQTCLTAAAKARCDAQEAECIASKAPAALCTAARMACH
jgi:hypothetical protein